MRKIHPVLHLWAILFPVFSVKGYSQNTLRFFKLTVAAGFPETAAPQPIDLDQVTQIPDSIIALIELKDGKKQPIAAQTEKKGYRCLHWMVVSGEDKKSTHSYETSKKTAMEANMQTQTRL